MAGSHESCGLEEMLNMGPPKMTTQNESPSKRILFWSYVALSTLPILVFLPHLLSWDFMAELMAPFAILGGILGSFVWLATAAITRRLSFLYGGIVLGSLCAAALVVPVDELRISLWMLRYKGEYSRQVQEILKDPEGWQVRNPNARTYVDVAGSEVRVGFVLDGILDNWVGIVYDDTGEVMRVNALDDETEWRESPITQLFGGDMTYARHLEGNWYLCSFT